MKKNDNFSPIICEEKNNLEFTSEILEEHFYQIFRELQQYYGCSYLSFRCEDAHSNKRFNFSTNPDWEQTFLRDKLIDNCALVKEGSKLIHARPNQDLVAQWDAVIHKTKKEKLVNDARKDFGIFHGMSISIEKDGVKKLLGIATEEKNKHFVRHALSDPKRLKTLVLYLRHYADEALLKIK